MDAQLLALRDGLLGRQHLVVWQLLVEPVVLGPELRNRRLGLRQCQLRLLPGVDTSLLRCRSTVGPYPIIEHEGSEL
jgi:hypothetical protein